MNDDYFVKMNYQNNNNDYKVFHGNQLKALRKANITARQAAKGLTPGGISFNPDAIAQNGDTQSLGPNSGPERPRGQYVPGAFSKLVQGYSGNGTRNELWVTPNESRNARASRNNKTRDNPHTLHNMVMAPTPSPSKPWYRTFFGGKTKRNRNRNRKQKTKKQRKSRK
jgi:hypothetical protein